MKRRPLVLTTVWNKGVKCLTTPDIDPEVAIALGFEEYIPSEKKYPDAPAQFYIEKPNKEKTKVLKKAIKKMSDYPQDIVIKPYTALSSAELGWKEWNGFNRGFKPNPDMEEIGQRLIKSESCFSHLTAARIKYMYIPGKPEPDPDHGRFELAFVQMGNRFAKILGKIDFLMCTYVDVWDSMLHDWQKERLVFHELLHCGFRGEPYMIDHDIEEFSACYKKWNVPIGESIYGNLHEQVQLGLEQLKEDEQEEKAYQRKNRGRETDY